MEILDHFVLAAADLEQAKEEFADLSGCMAIDGGSHLGLGTRNALCSLADVGTDSPDCYIELIAPDEMQTASGALNKAWGNFYEDLNQLTLLHYAVRVTDMQSTADRANQLGFTSGPILDVSRQQPDGPQLDWRLMGLKQHQLGGMAPFFIDWLDCIHPSLTTPRAGKLTKFEVTTEDLTLTNLLGPIENTTTQSGDAQLTIQLETNRGEIQFTGTNLQGFSL